MKDKILQKLFENSNKSLKATNIIAQRASLGYNHTNDSVAEGDEHYNEKCCSPSASNHQLTAYPAILAGL